jgi:hypothetical protein
MLVGNALVLAALSVGQVATGIAGRYDPEGRGEGVSVGQPNQRLESTTDCKFL